MKFSQLFSNLLRYVIVIETAGRENNFLWIIYSSNGKIFNQIIIMFYFCYFFSSFCCCQFWYFCLFHEVALTNGWKISNNFHFSWYLSLCKDVLLNIMFKNLREIILILLLFFFVQINKDFVCVMFVDNISMLFLSSW